MFELICSVPDIFNTGIYIVAKQAFGEVIERAGIANYFENNINFKSHGSTVSSSVNDNGLPQLQQNRADVAIQYTSGLTDQRWEVAKAADEYQQMLSHMQHSNHKVIFYDPTNSISIMEFDRPLTINCTCILYFNDLVGATDAQQRLQSIYTNGIISHDLMYSYFLPASIYVRLYQLYKFADKDPSEFMDYLSMFSGQRIIKTTNRHDNNDLALSVKKTKGGVISSIEPIQGTPNPVGNEKSPDMYEIPLNISTQLSMSNLISIRYPIVMNNKLIPNEYIPLKEDMVYSPANESHPYFSIDKYLRLLKQNSPLPEEPVHVPWYDNWRPRGYKFLNDYKPFFISIVLLDDIDNEEGYTDIDLHDNLGGIEFIEDVKNAITEQGIDILHFRSNISVSVFRNEIMIEPTSLELIDDHILRITNRNTSGVYHLVVAASDIIWAAKKSIQVINADITI
jgi:hypothetical protein